MPERRDDHRRKNFSSAPGGKRLTRRVVFGTMAGGDDPGLRARPENIWARCLADDL